MARTYDLTDLQANDATDADWALAYVRFALRDKPNENSAYPLGSLQDEEITAALTGMALVDEVPDPDVTYYPAHRVAAALLSANPEFVQRWSSGGTSEELRPVKDVAREIITAGSWIDVAIADASSGRVSPGQLRLVT